MIKWKITIEGLPNIFMDGSSSGLIRSQLRKKGKLKKNDN